MLRQFSDIKNFALAARDGEIGKAREFYFDDESWIVRYLVVDTGGWLTGRSVLIAPQSLGAVNEERELIAVKLTKAQVENSPPVEMEKPVSRQYEEEFHRYYGYPGYWLAPEIVGLGAAPSMAEAVPELLAKENVRNDRGDPHLRSTSEVDGYAIHATDGDIGQVDDFIVDDADWANPLPGHLTELVAGEESDSCHGMDRSGELGRAQDLRAAHAGSDQGRARMG